MARQRGSRSKGNGNGDKPSGGGNGNGKRAAPYDSRQSRKSGSQPATTAKGGAGGRKNGGGAAKGKGGGRGGGRGGSGRGRGGDKPKPKTAEDLDREMDSYWGKSEEHAQKKLDSDMDDYWKNKDATKEATEGADVEVVEDKVGEPAAAEATEGKAE